MTTCPTCKGSGRTKGPDMRMHICDTCGGKGTVESAKAERAEPRQEPAKAERTERHK